MAAFVEIIKKINDSINSVVWGVPALVLIISTGVLFTFRSKFFQVRRFGWVLKNTIVASLKKDDSQKAKDKRSISQFQAMATALAATIGTGNIVGVATAITIGGAGSVFWMWISAFFGMMTGFAENVLGIYFRRKNEKGEWIGGPMLYIEKGLKCKPLAIIFAIFCVLASFGIGNMTQANSMSSSLHATFNIPPIASGIVVAAIVAFAALGGIKRLGKITEKLIPFMAVIYIIATVTIIILNINTIPGVLKDIFKGAFGLDSAVGGISGYLIKTAMTQGLKRGVFSNEAGLGSSVMVHCAADSKEPVQQGLWSMFEIFVDTIIVCSLTAFSILSTGVVEAHPGVSGAPLVIFAFSDVFGSFAGAILSISILLFAFSTILGWSYYGEKSVEYLFGTKVVPVYKVIFVALIIVGATAELELVWSISDTFNGLMALPNLIAVLLLSGTVIKILKNYNERKFKKSKDKAIVPMLSFHPEIQKEYENEVMLQDM